MVCYLYQDMVYRTKTKLIGILTTKSIVYKFQNDYQVIDYFREKKKKKNEGKIIFEEFIVPVREIISFEQLRINDCREESKLVNEEIVRRNREEGIQKMKRYRDNLKYILLSIRFEMPHIYSTISGYYFYKFKDDKEFKTVVNLWCNPAYRDIVIEKYGNLSFWDTSNVTDMKDLFSNLSPSFNFKNFDISTWNVSNVKNMNRMFQGFTYFDCDLNKWDVSNVENMGYMFKGCSNFNKPLNWNTKNVKNMEYMFFKCSRFNSPINMDLSQVRNLNGFLKECYFFNQPLEHLNIMNCKTMKEALYYCRRFDQPLNNWDVSNVKNMGYLFKKCEIFNQDLTMWDLSNVNTLEMFNSSYKMEKNNKPKFN